MNKDLLPIKKIAEIFNISEATVNYYTNLGLFQVADRIGNKRLYNRSDIMTRFEKIKELRKQGYPLGLIQQKLYSEGQGVGNDAG